MKEPGCQLGAFNQRRQVAVLVGGMEISANGADTVEIGKAGGGEEIAIGRAAGVHPGKGS